MFLVTNPPAADLNVIAWILIAALLVYTVTIAPIRGRGVYQRLAATRATDSHALLRFYRRNMTRKWLLLIPVILILAFSPHVHPRNLGFAWPYGRTNLPWLLSLEVGGVIAITSLFYRSAARSGRPIPGQRQFQNLLPQTKTEKHWAYAFAATAGITEEVLFRGLILNAGIWAGLPIGLALVISSLLFGAVHIYQGVRGVVMTTVIGLLLGWFYLATLSLVLPVVLHILLDLRALVWVPLAPLNTTTPAPRPPTVDDDIPKPLVRSPFPTG